MMQGTAIRDSVCAVLVLAAFAIGITMCMHSAGCAPPPARVLNAVEVGKHTLPYGMELDVCRDEAKKLPKDQRFEAYVHCEAAATEAACRRLTPVQRAAWSECDRVRP